MEQELADRMVAYLKKHGVSRKGDVTTLALKNRFARSEIAEAYDIISSLLNIGFFYRDGDSFVAWYDIPAEEIDRMVLQQAFFEAL